jgi:hypothetical protein
MSKLGKTTLLAMAAFLVFCFVSPLAYAGDVDLGTWTAESYPAVSGFDPGDWQVQPGNLIVEQVNNGQPTLFYSDFNAIGSAVVGSILVTGGDDDYIGFALGFQPGDSTNSGADYLLIDWKSVDQPFDFGSPSCHAGGLALAGLAVSRITGVPTADEFWQHSDYPACDVVQTGGLSELQRGLNLGATGWVLGTTYEISFEFTSTSLKVYVDGVEEINITGSFGDGRLAFYNFSQAGVEYSGFEVVPFEPDINIKPGSDPNSINLCSGGSTPATIWGSDILDVATIDVDQLVLASASIKTVGKSNRSLCSIEDVGGPDEAFFDNLDPIPDGYADLTCHFTTIGLTELDDTSTESNLSITGCDAGVDCEATSEGYYVATASDSVNIVKDCDL